MIYDYWPEGLAGILTRSGAFDDSPLIGFLQKMLDEHPNGPQRKVVVSAVDVNTGTYVTFTEKDPIDKMIMGVVSSASIPFIFPHRKIGNNVLMDGGTVWNTNLVSAVDRCLELVDDES